jgi:hypothetical protein
MHRRRGISGYDGVITNKNYSEAEQILHAVDKLMLDLIEDMGGNVVRSGLWT